LQCQQFKGAVSILCHYFLFVNSLIAILNPYTISVVDTTL